MRKLNVGFVTTLSGRWPRELPEQRLREYSKWLKDSLPDVNVITYNEIISDMNLVDDAVENFRKQLVDIVILVYGAFTGDDIPCGLADGLNVPMILWAPKEPPFERDDRLYANALVSATMNGASLHRLKKEYHVIYGDKEDAETSTKLFNLLTGYNVIKKLNSTLLGLYGYRPTAFYNSTFDEGLIRRVFGVRMEETDLKVVFDRMDEVDEKALKEDMAAMAKIPGSEKLPPGHLENHSRLTVALKEITAEQGYDISVIKCWPEMGNLKTTPCAAIGRLMDMGMPISCEGDVDAALASIVQIYLTGKPTFMTDMINMEPETNTLTYWHCGQAALSLYDESEELEMNNHPLAGQGAAFYGALKPGKVTVARFCNIHGEYKLFLLKGEAVRTKRNTRGVMVNVKAQTPASEILDTIINRGIPHHYSIVWEDIAEKMKTVARLLNIEVIEV